MKPSLLRRFGAVVVWSLVVSTVTAPGPSFAEGPTGSPIHGTRAKAGDGTLVVYDNVVGSYRVPDRQNAYWFGERFFLYENGVWLTAAAIAGPWDLSSAVLVPVALRERHTPPKKKVSAKLPWGAEAVYDPAIKVYKVAGKAGVFLFDGGFYRYDGGVWLTSKREEGPWELTSVKGLPPPLRRAVGKPEDKKAVKLPSGETVLYDAASDLFRVDGKTDTWLFDGNFYEKREAKWFASTKSAAGFEEVTPSKVPAPLRVHYRPKDGTAGEKGGKKQPAGDKSKAAGKPKAPAGAKAAGDKAAKPAKTPKPEKAAKPEKGAKPAKKPAAKTPPATNEEDSAE